MDQATVETIVTAIVGLATTFITVILAPILMKQAKVADGKLSEQARDRLYPALNAAIDYARSLLNGDEQAKLAASDKLKGSVVGSAGAYIKDRFGKTLDELGVNDDHLEGMLRARLQSALDYLATPATK